MGIAKIYRYANALSLDVVTGAVCSALFFARLFGDPIASITIVTLALTVWLIYTVDHLNDSRSVEGRPSGPRHIYHQRHSRILLSILICGSIICAVMVFALPSHVLVNGAVLVLLVVMYLIFQKQLRAMKEFVVAVLYTTGVIVPSLRDYVNLAQWWDVIVGFMLVAFLNLLIFSWFDYENDIKDGHPSAVTALGKATSRVLIWIVFFLMGCILLVGGFSTASWIVLVMGLVQITLFIFQSHFAAGDRFRLIGDAAFYIPALIFLFEPI